MSVSLVTTFTQDHPLPQSGQTNVHTTHECYRMMCSGYSIQLGATHILYVYGGPCH